MLFPDLKATKRYRITRGEGYGSALTEPTQAEETWGHWILKPEAKNKAKLRK
jgi:hypothetical protein